MRSPIAHKGDVGFVYILAGSPGLTGAAALSAEAAMRSGCGLAMVGVPQSLNSILEEKLTEAMTQPLPETDDHHLSAAGWEVVKARLDWADAIAFGPGVGGKPATGALLKKVMYGLKKPLIIDADGLNLLAANPALLRALPAYTILTPHPGELSRLTGLPIAKILADPIGIARSYAKKWRATLHLKGAPSLTATPEGAVYINSSGNSGMATGGSGDVLTGIIATMAAQGLTPGKAAVCGAYIHGAAGDAAAEKVGRSGMLAGDIISHIPGVLKEFE